MLIDVLLLIFYVMIIYLIRNTLNIFLKWLKLIIIIFIIIARLRY